VGKRPSFIEVATRCLSFLVDDQGFDGPETTEWSPQSFPAITCLRYHRGEMTIEVCHVVAYMGENYVQTRCSRKDDEGWIDLGRNTAHSGYQLRRAVDRQADAIHTHLALAVARELPPDRGVIDR
jgi:hypothetical protein